MHDFNNVLSVILSYGDMLFAEMKPDEPMRVDVEEIRKPAGALPASRDNCSRSAANRCSNQKFSI